MSQNKPMGPEIIEIGPKGEIQLPAWAVSALLKSAKLRSRKKRQMRKTLKKEFTRCLILGMEEMEK